jgi:hypothetical protein
VRLLAAADSGVIDGKGGVQTIYGLDRTMSPASLTRCLTGISVIDDTTLHVIDSCTGFLVELARQPL